MEQRVNVNVNVNELLPSTTAATHERIEGVAEVSGARDLPKTPSMIEAHNLHTLRLSQRSSHVLNLNISSLP